MRLARGLAVTVLVPLILLVVARWLTLPGISEELVERAGSSRATVGVFALGITPILSAYWIVEVTALLVPRWSRLRHGNPEGRAKLDRAARILAIVLAALQGYALALTLQMPFDVAGGDSSFGVRASGFSVPLVTVSLIAGVCLQFLAARLVSRHGLLNGFVALGAGGLLVELADDVKTHPGVSAASGLALAAAIAATWLVLRGAGSAGRADHAADADAAGSAALAYRDARHLAARPWIPLPSSSFQAYLGAASLLLLPSTLVNLHVPAEGIVRALETGGATFTLTLAVVTGVVMMLFASLLHRPAEMADLARRLGAGDADSLQRQARDALRASLIPSSLFFLAVLLAASASPLDVVAVVIVTPMVMDLVHTLRAVGREPTLVPVWEERRASAVPVLRAALAAEGIGTETQGMFVLSFWQIFAPYAPARILVKRDDAERATRTLRHLLLGEEASAPVAAPEAAAPVLTAPWPARRRIVALAGAAVVAGLALFLARLPEPDATSGPPVPRAELEVVRIDDSIDPFAGVDPDDGVPADQGISILREMSSLGPAAATRVDFARIVFRPGETRSAAIARVQPWLATLHLPPGARFGFEDVVEPSDDATPSFSTVGVRTFVLSGEPVLRTADVTDAEAKMSPGDLPEVYVSVTLSADGARRFEAVTREWVKRRMAIVVDGVIDSAPIIQTVIAGGHISITMGSGGDPEARIAQAKRLARGLRSP